MHGKKNVCLNVYFFIVSAILKINDISNVTDSLNTCLFAVSPTFSSLPCCLYTLSMSAHVENVIITSPACLNKTKK